MDLVSVAVDDNGLLKSPKWAFQVTHPGELPDPRQLCPGDLHHPGPECTSQQTSIDSARICPNEGHVNWFPCTYEGPIFWIAVSDVSHDNFGADDDYQWNLQPPDQAGLTANNDRFIELEFDSTETINHFATPWWDSFHDTADESDEKAKEVVDGKFAIVTGLIGLDCAHSCSTESHPVYAMAIHVEDDPADDVWAMFVRNWGNEGFCSDKDHQFAFTDNTYTFRLPWRPGA